MPSVLQPSWFVFSNLREFIWEFFWLLRDTIILSLILGSSFCLRLGMFGLRICFALQEFRGKAENDSL